MLSKYSRRIADEYGIKIGGVKNLIPNLRNKTEYEKFSVVFIFRNKADKNSQNIKI